MAGKQTLRQGPIILVHQEHSGFKTNALALVTIFMLVLFFVNLLWIGRREWTVETTKSEWFENPGTKTSGTFGVQDNRSCLT